jgi:hypothetical protein
MVYLGTAAKTEGTGETQWSYMIHIVLVEKLIVTQVGRIFTAIYETQ